MGRERDIQIENMVSLRYREIERDCFTVPIKPLYQTTNQLIAGYWTIFEIPDSDAKSLFRSISWYNHTSHTSYQCCKYQLLLVIIEGILELADPGSTLARQAGECLDTLAALISALDERDDSRESYRLVSFMGTVFFTGSGTIGGLLPKS